MLYSWRPKEASVQYVFFIKYPKPNKTFSTHKIPKNLSPTSPLSPPASNIIVEKRGRRKKAPSLSLKNQTAFFLLLVASLMLAPLLRSKKKMTDFTQTAVSMSAKRELTEPITDLTAFENIVASLINDETIGLTKKETGSISYTAKITYFNAAGDEAGKISLTAPSKTAYEDGISLLKGTEAAETIGGVGASASEEADKALWNTRISCAIADDTFNVSLNRDSIVITGYAKAETLEAIENWADTVDALA